MEEMDFHCVSCGSIYSCAIKYQTKASFAVVVMDTMAQEVWFFLLLLTA